MYSILCVLLCSTVLLTTDVVISQEYVEYFRPGGVKGWIKAHKIIATWEEAFEKCRSEGATLVAPTTHVMFGVLMDLIRDRSKKYKGQYLIDVTSRFAPREFMTFKGVPLRRLPIGHYIHSLEWEDGDCLSIDHQQIRVVSCSERLPYFCFKADHRHEVMTECGTFDEEYTYNRTTGSCYKFHNVRVSWDQAFKTCSDEGGYLTIINNKRENKVVLGLITASIWNTYVGLRILKTGDGWLSIHGHRLKSLYNKWINATLKETNVANKCGAIGHQSGRLYSFDCTELRVFVCEKDPGDIMFANYD